MEIKIYNIKGIEIEIKKESKFHEPKVEFKGVSKLEGTPKQIKWADSIRKEQVVKMLNRYRNFKASVKKYYNLVEDDDKIQKMNQEFEDYVFEFLSQKSAAEWIKNRNFYEFENIFKEKFRHIFKPETKQSVKSPKINI